jgi:hypothetical protein
MPIAPPTGAINGANCVEIGVGTAQNTLDLTTATVLTGMGSYSPQTHGVYIVAGWRDYDNNGTAGVNSDDLIWASVGNSVQYIPPVAAGTLNSMPSFTVSGSVVTFGASASWSAGSSATDYLVACTSSRTATTSPVTSTTLTTGCRPLYGDSAMQNPVTDLATAWVNTGNSTVVPYVPSTHGGYIAIISIAGGVTPNTAVSTATYTYQAASQQVETTPYTGPVVNAPGALKPVAPGAKVVLPGSNLTGVSKATINGKDAAVKVNSAGELEIVVPKDLAVGTYDLVVTSDSGVLTVQDAIRVQTAPNGIKGEATDVSTKLKEDNTVKVYVTNVVGAGKVQIFLNGKEIAWVNTDNPDDAKLLNEYLVRTLELSEGKNVIEIYVNLKRVDRKAYTLVDDSSKI